MQKLYAINSCVYFWCKILSFNKGSMGIDSLLEPPQVAIQRPALVLHIRNVHLLKLCSPCILLQWNAVTTPIWNACYFFSLLTLSFFPSIFNNEACFVNLLPQRYLLVMNLNIFKSQVFLGSIMLSICYCTQKHHFKKKKKKSKRLRRRIRKYSCIKLTVFKDTIM